MLLKIILTILAAIVSGILGRMGGSDTYSTKWRDIGCALIACAVVCMWFGWHWTLILAFGAQFGALTTYFKKKGEPVRWYNWLLVGIAWNVAFIPYVIAQGMWTGFGIRLIVLPIVIMAWCCMFRNAVVEELGRYFLLVVTIPLFALFYKRKEK